MQVEAVEVGLTGSPGRRRLDVRRPPEARTREPAREARRYPSLDRGAGDPGQHRGFVGELVRRIGRVVAALQTVADKQPPHPVAALIADPRVRQATVS